MQKSLHLALVAGAGTLAGGELQAAVSYTNPGVYEDTSFPIGNASRYQHQYKQFFDTGIDANANQGLPNSPTDASLQTSRPWADDTTGTASRTSIPGWYLYHPLTVTEGGTNGHQRLRAGTGSANTASFWSFGPAGSGDRALGMVSGDTLSTPSDAPTPPATLEEQQGFIALQIRNDSSQTLTEFTIKFDGEQWRRSGSDAPDKLDFQYSLDPAASVSAANSLFTDVDALDFNAPNNVGALGALDGNATANRTVFGPLTITGINWAPGTDLWLRWADTNQPGATSALRADAGLAIDNLGFSANVPEPTGLALLALGAAGLLGRRRD